MSEPVDYFANHAHKLRFPWNLYHSPIVGGLKRAVDEAPGPEVLNVGSGPFFEFDAVYRPDRNFTVCDIDPRAVELAQSQHGSKLARADALQPDAPLPYADEQFDLVVSMDVIEHLVDPKPWLSELSRVLRKGGHLYLTTPNYGTLSLLPVIEKTALELIARRQGFSRRHLHPTQFSKGMLTQSLREARFTHIQVERVAFAWVLIAHAEKGVS